MLTHYIFVRRDLPLGVAAAMVTHAAGESSVLYPIQNYGEKFFGARAVVLAVKNREALLGVTDYLDEQGISYVPIIENSEPYDGQLMAVGLVPIEQTLVEQKLSHYQTLKTLEPPPPQDDVCGCEICYNGSRVDIEEGST